MDGGMRRAGAVVGAIILPLAWLLTLRTSTEFLVANGVRVSAAAAAAALLWAIRHRSFLGATWRSCLLGGVIGSIGVTALSVTISALGPFSASGWLVSGIVGGTVVALGIIAARGTARSPRRSPGRPGPGRSWVR